MMDVLVAAKIRTEWRSLLTALCDLAPLEAAWTSAFFRGHFQRLYERDDDDLPEISFKPADPRTWDALFGFFGTKSESRGKTKNNAYKYYSVDQDPPQDLPQDFTWKRISDLLKALKKIEFGDFAKGLKKNDPATWANGLGRARRTAVKRKRYLERNVLLEPKTLTDQPGEETRYAKTLGFIRTPMAAERFIGRDPILDELARDLGIGDVEHGPNCALNAIALHGAGGIGKTQLVVQYASKWEAAYKAVLNTTATKIGDLAASLSSLFPRADSDESRAALINWSHQPGPRLLVLDNVDTRGAAAEVIDLVKTLGPVHVLITTRIVEWDPGEHKIVPKKIDLLLPTDAATFLLKWSGRREDERTSADGLVEDLGGITSLLRYAAGHIKARAPFRISEYRELWATKRDEIATWFDPDQAESKERTGYPTLEAAMTWQTSFDELDDDARELFKELCWFGAERIPRSLVRADRVREKALRQISRLSLLLSDDDDGFSINSALQDTTRAALTARSDYASLGEAAKHIGGIFALDRPGFLPHALSVLHFIQDRRRHITNSTDVLNALGREAVFEVVAASNEPATFRRLPRKYLTSVLFDFYEIEPLEPILKRLVETPELWLENRPTFISINNYVLRYALGEAIGHSWKVDQVEDLLKNAENLNEFEIAGYALNIAYGNNQDKIPNAKRFILRLCERNEYSGRSILGDLFLQLAYSGFTLGTLQRLANAKFWNARWQFIQLDVDMVRAIRKTRGDRVPTRGITSPLSALEFIQKERRILLRTQGLGTTIKELIRDYESLGSDPNKFGLAVGELDQLEQRDILQRVMRLFFAHPIWSVAESAATNLSKLAREENPRGKERLKIIKELLLWGGDWRINFGACEAAYAVSVIDKSKLFFESIELFYRHPSSKIRGLCAENLFAMMLTSDPRKISEIYNKFRVQMEYWIQEENDAWVLDHVHRLFNTLAMKEISVFLDGTDTPVDPDQLASVSPLLTDVDGDQSWYRLSREEFLCHIERQRAIFDKKIQRQRKRRRH